MTANRRYWRHMLAGAIFVIAIVVLAILYPRTHNDVPTVIATEIKPKIILKAKSVQRLPIQETSYSIKEVKPAAKGIGHDYE